MEEAAREVDGQRNKPSKVSLPGIRIVRDSKAETGGSLKPDGQ